MKRKPNESFEDYKARRNNQHKVDKIRARGMPFWCPAKQGPYNKKQVLENELKCGSYGAFGDVEMSHLNSPLIRQKIRKEIQESRCPTFELSISQCIRGNCLECWVGHVYEEYIEDKSARECPVEISSCGHQRGLERCSECWTDICKSRVDNEI
jgi:hypothetical protein